MNKDRSLHKKQYRFCRIGTNFAIILGLITFLSAQLEATDWSTPVTVVNDALDFGMDTNADGTTSIIGYKKTDTHLVFSYSTNTGMNWSSPIDSTILLGTTPQISVKINGINAKVFGISNFNPLISFTSIDGGVSWSSVQIVSNLNGSVYNYGVSASGENLVSAFFDSDSNTFMDYTAFNYATFSGNWQSSQIHIATYPGAPSTEDVFRVALNGTVGNYMFTSINASATTIYFYASSNSGVNWGSPTTITGTTLGNKQFCQTAVRPHTPTPQALALWQDASNNIRVSHQSNLGVAAWGIPTSLNTADPGVNSYPQLAVNETDGNVAIVVWNQNGTGIYSRTSTDFGVTWSLPPVLISNDVENDGQPQIGLSSDGNTAIVIWLGAGKVASAISTNQGTSWTPLSNLSTASGTSPKLALTADGSKALGGWLEGTSLKTNTFGAMAPTPPSPSPTPAPTPTSISVGSPKSIGTSVLAAALNWSIPANLFDIDGNTLIHNIIIKRAQVMNIPKPPVPIQFLSINNPWRMTPPTTYNDFFLQKNASYHYIVEAIVLGMPNVVLLDTVITTGSP